MGCGGGRGTTRVGADSDRPWLGSTSCGARGNGRGKRVHGPPTQPIPPPRNPGRELRLGPRPRSDESEAVERENCLLDGVDLAVDVVFHRATDIVGDRSRRIPELAIREAVLLDVGRE
jgi:hypothetical protein